jgi:hypothetical protein
LTENKFSKYLLYAIGEISLVMIGILLALQVSNWNHLRIESAKEQMFLKNLQTDFKNNLIEYNLVNNRGLEAYHASVNLLDIIKNDSPIEPSKIEALIDLIINKIQSLDLVSGTIDEIINTGSLNIIKDAELRKRLSNWSFHLADTRDDIVIMNGYLFDFFIPSLTNKTILRNTSVPTHFEDNFDLPKISMSGFKIDYNKTIRTLEFENQVYNNTLNYMYTLNSYKIIEVYLIDTLKLIEANIN